MGINFHEIVLPCEKAKISTPCKKPAIWYTFCGVLVLGPIPAVTHATIYLMMDSTHHISTPAEPFYLNTVAMCNGNRIFEFHRSLDMLMVQMFYESLDKISKFTPGDACVIHSSIQKFTILSYHNNH